VLCDMEIERYMFYTLRSAITVLEEHCDSLSNLALISDVDTAVIPQLTTVDTSSHRSDVSSSI